MTTPRGDELSASDRRRLAWAVKAGTRKAKHVQQRTGKPPTADELRRMKVPMADPLPRVLAASFGFVTAVAGALVTVASSMTLLGVALIFVGALFVMGACVGVRKTVGSVRDNAGERLIDLILQSLP